MAERFIRLCSTFRAPARTLRNAIKRRKKHQISLPLSKTRRLPEAADLDWIGSLAYRSQRQGTQGEDETACCIADPPISMSPLKQTRRWSPPALDSLADCAMGVRSRSGLLGDRRSRVK